MLELLQKHIRQRDLSELLDPLITLLTQDHLTDTQLSVLINYMLKAGNAAEPGALIRQLAQGAPQYQGTTDDNSGMAGRKRPNGRVAKRP